MNQYCILPYSRVDHLIAADSHPQNLISWERAIASEHPASTDYGFYAFNERYSNKNRSGGLRLNAAQVKDLYGAVAYANTRGLVMNCHVSITWSLLGILDHTEASNTLTHRVIKALKQWYKWTFFQYLTCPQRCPQTNQKSPDARERW